MQSGLACGAVAGHTIRLRGDACPAAARGHAARARALPVRVRRSGLVGTSTRSARSLLFMYTSILGAQAAQVVGSGAWAVRGLIGAVFKGRGREL